MPGFDDVHYYFRQAARVMDLSSLVETMLVTPYREVKVDVSIALDDGQLGTFIGYRVQHDRSRGPMKGGLRFHPSVDLDEALGRPCRPASSSDSPGASSVRSTTSSARTPTSPPPTSTPTRR